jgi:hypothetical protein
MLMKIEGVIKNGQSRETGNNGHTWHMTQDTGQRQTKQKQQQDICWTPLYVSKDN